MCHDLLGHLLDIYGKIMTSDLEANNQKMNEPIDSSLLIDKYFEHIYDCVQFNDDGNIIYMEAQVTPKSHHKVLASGIYVDACKKWRKKTQKKDMDWVQEYFCG